MKDIVIRNEYEIETISYGMCITCLLDHGSEFDGGVIVNHETMRILIQNVELVDHDDCEDCND